MIKRTSSLPNNATQRSAENATVALEEQPALALFQLAAWPQSAEAFAKRTAQWLGLPKPPRPGQSVAANDVALLRVAPLRWWQLGGSMPVPEPEQAMALDLSHAFAHLRVSGADAAVLLNRHLPVNLADGAFPEGAVASTSLHHVGVTVWRSPRGLELFLPRGYAQSLYEVLLESAAQFGVQPV